MSSPGDLLWCKQQIWHVYENQPNLQHYLSQLTRQAWGEEYKPSCLNEFGSISSVQHFLVNPGDISLLEIPEEHGVAEVESLTGIVEEPVTM